MNVNFLTCLSDAIKAPTSEHYVRYQPGRPSTNSQPEAVYKTIHINRMPKDCARNVIYATGKPIIELMKRFVSTTLGLGALGYVVYTRNSGSRLYQGFALVAGVALIAYGIFRQTPHRLVLGEEFNQANQHFLTN